jgi:hypothetical protein
MQVAKFPIIGLNQDDDDVNLKPGWCREIWNAIPKNGYSKSGIQNLKGTIVRANESLAAGTNTCIHAATDKGNSRIVYFIHNSNNDHSIWYFTPLTNTHTLILQTQYLGFDLAYPITSCDFMEDILSWTDGNQEARSLIVSRAVSNLYDFNDQDSFEKQISLYKVPPQYPPTATKTTGTSGFNNITKNSYQFCTQYLYHDNTVSTISPLSPLIKGDIFPKNTNVRNLITVSQDVEAALRNVIKKVYFIYVKNDDGNFQLFREVDQVADATSYSIDFYGTDTIQTIFPAQVNFIPNKSKNVVIHNQRSIVTMNQFDYEQPADLDTFTVETADVGTIPSGFSSDGMAHKICCPNSSYTVGFLYFDAFGRTPGITATRTVTIGNILQPLKLPSASQDTVQSTDNLRIQWTVAGTPPPWAKTYAIAVKPNNTLESAYSCLALPLFYVKEGTDAGANQFSDNGKIFNSNAQTGWDKQIYWKLPLNIPFSLDGSFKLRLLNNGIGQKIRETEDIISIVGDKIVTENFGITNWLNSTSGGANLSTTKGMFNVMLEVYKDEPDEVFFEVGQHYDCSGGTLSEPTGIIPGDYYYMNSPLLFERADSKSVVFAGFTLEGGINYGGVYGDRLQLSGTNAGKPITVPVISQSPTHSTLAIEDVKTTAEKQQKKRRKKGFLGVVKSLGTAAALIPGVGTAVAAASAGIGVIAGATSENIDDSDKVTETVTLKLAYTPDYNKICSDSGRAWIDTKNKKINYEPNTLSISDPFVINSKVNGLSDFRELYQIPSNRTPIRKLVSVGASNVILAVHERATTSLATYTGNILNTTDGSQLFGDGKNIIGYNNELTGGFGTIYPDSVVPYNGKVYFFDPHLGEVVRYAQNGNTPIGSKYKMHNFFRTKGDQFIDPTGRNVIGGYDGNLDILWLTFRSTSPSEEITVAFIDRDGEERWISFEEFLPERYAYINERLFGFVNGTMWEFNANSTRNLFFDVQYTTRVKHLFNAEFSREKMLSNIGVESNKAWAFSPITVAKYGVEQVTSLAKSNFVRRDDIFYADVKRDRNTAPGLIPAGKSALVAGQPMIGKVYDITLENYDTELVELDFLNYGYIPQSGHNIV